MADTNSVSKVLKKNTSLACSAAVLEAGRIANKQASKVIAGKLPMFIGPYANTPIGRLVIANIVQIGIEHFRPDDARLSTLSNAMVVQAYQELIQTMDIDAMIDAFLEDKTIKTAMGKIPTDD